MSQRASHKPIELPLNQPKPSRTQEMAWCTHLEDCIQTIIFKQCSLKYHGRVAEAIKCLQKPHRDDHVVLISSLSIFHWSSLTQHPVWLRIQSDSGSRPPPPSNLHTYRLPHPSNLILPSYIQTTSSIQPHPTFIHTDHLIHPTSSYIHTYRPPPPPNSGLLESTLF